MRREETVGISPVQRRVENRSLLATRKPCISLIKQQPVDGNVHVQVAGIKRCADFTHDEVAKMDSAGPTAEIGTRSVHQRIAALAPNA